MKKFILACAALASVASVASVANAQEYRERPSRTVLLATTQIGPFDYDRLDVNSCSGSERERVAAIQLRVTKRVAKIDNVRVVYANGNYDDIRLGLVMSEGNRTNWIDLEGRARCVRTIEISGTQASLRGRATVEIYGMKRERPDWENPRDRRDDDRGPGRDDRGPGRDDRGPGRDDRGPGRGDDRGPGRGPRR